MVLTGLTKLKLGDVFKDMPNVTIATSSGLLYSWGASIQSAEDESIEEEAHEAAGERLCVLFLVFISDPLNVWLQGQGRASGVASIST